MIFYGVVIEHVYHTWYRSFHRYARHSLRLCLMRDLNRVKHVAGEARNEVHEHVPRTIQHRWRGTDQLPA